MENIGAGRIRPLIPGWVSIARRIPWHSGVITTTTDSQVWNPGEVTKADSLLANKIRVHSLDLDPQAGQQRIISPIVAV